MTAQRAYLLQPQVSGAEIVPNVPPMTVDNLDPAHPRDTELGPDYAFVRADRLPARTSPEYSKALHLAPDLAVEVASENQFAPGMEAKAKTYLTFGTRLVWVIWPRYKRVDVWRPGGDRPTPLGLGDTLDGEDVVPGFTYPVERLFL